MKLLKLGVFAGLLVGLYYLFLMLPAEMVWLHVVVALFGSFALSTVLFSFLNGKQRG